MTKIVLIEDDREISNTLQRVLEGAGYVLSVANNGVDGRKLIDSAGPELVITDMMMPRMGGFPILEHIREMAASPKVIMVTANEGGRHKAYAEMLGADAYLRKPFSMDVLLETIVQVLEKPAPGRRSAGASRGSARSGKGPVQRRS